MGLPGAKRPEGQKSRRKPLRADLPRQRVEYNLADDQKVGPWSSERMYCMGEVVAEQLHRGEGYGPTECPRQICRKCDRTGIVRPIVIAPMPAQPLPGSIATAFKLAFPHS